MTAVLQELPRPDVRSGPVIFARRIRLKAFNGATNCGLTFSSLVACRQNYWFLLLYNAAVAGHAAGVRLIRETKVMVLSGVLSKGFTNQRFYANDEQTRRVPFHKSVRG